jgi:hypothetical protein
VPAAGALPDATREAVLRGGDMNDMRGDMRLGDRRASVEVMDERLIRLEKSVVSVLSILKKMVTTPQGAAATQPAEGEE